MASASSSAQPHGLHPAAPIPALGIQYQLTAADGTATDANVLPSQAGTWLVSERINCVSWDEAWVLCQYDAHASTTTGAGWLIARGTASAGQTTSTQNAPPAVTDDVWGMLPCLDGSLTATAPGGTMAGGSIETGTTSAGLQKVYGELVQLPAAAANSAKIRAWVRFKVRGLRWLHFEMAEGVDLTNRGKLRLYVVGVV